MKATHLGAEEPSTLSERSGIGSFMVLSCAITWLTLGPWFYLFNRVWHREVPGWVWGILPILILGGWGPSVAAVICAGLDEGRQGVRRLFRSLLVWRVSIGWYLFALLTPLVLTAVATWMSGFGAAARERFDVKAMLGSVPLAYLSALPFGPGEELGWRGYALPRLLRSYGIWGSTLLLGAAWTLWHAPMIFLMPGAALPEFMPPSVGSIAVYLARCVAITGIMTFVYCNTRGSVLLAVLFHLTFNTSESILFSGLPTPTDDQLLQIYLINVGLMAALAVPLLGWLGLRVQRSAGLDLAAESVGRPRPLEPSSPAAPPRPGRRA